RLQPTLPKSAGGVHVAVATERQQPRTVVEAIVNGYRTGEREAVPCHAGRRGLGSNESHHLHGLLRERGAAAGEEDGQHDHSLLHPGSVPPPRYGSGPSLASPIIHLSRFAQHGSDSEGNCMKAASRGANGPVWSREGVRLEERARCWRCGVSG